MERLFIGSAELELATWCPYATMSTTACKELLLLVPASWHSCRSSFISEQSDGFVGIRGAWLDARLMYSSQRYRAVRYVHTLLIMMFLLLHMGEISIFFVQT